MRFRLNAAVTALTVTLIAPPVSSQERGKTAPESDLETLHRLIKPVAGEARWAEVPWMPSANIWAARRKAVEEGRPLLIWYMAGEPLGVC